MRDEKLIILFLLLLYRHAYYVLCVLNFVSINGTLKYLFDFTFNETYLKFGQCVYYIIIEYI